MPDLTLAIVGTAFAAREARDAFAQMREGDEVRLDRQPDNEHDQNAVTCLFLGLQVGWVPRKLNPPVAEAIDRGRTVTAVCSRPPEMRGDRVQKDALIRVSWE